MPVFHGSWSLGALAGAGIGTLAVALGLPLTSQLLVLGVISLAALTVLTSRLLPSDQNNHHHAPPAAPRPRPPSWAVAFDVAVHPPTLCEG